ncbi:hypothetical protein DU67_17895 [Methanosarcina mazei]|uniref:Uncharacterized protein n=1 Tax=Methanosarcina mazei TaxID=2209 RepID=A0A0F8GR51_METMZ|nr:hypothetical protein DU67_17895 [Methanosarcina mazei]
MIPIQKLKLQIPNIFVYKCLETGLKFGFQVPELSPVESVVKRTAFPKCKNQIAGGHPTLKDGVCFGPPARLFW